MTKLHRSVLIALSIAPAAIFAADTEAVNVKDFAVKPGGNLGAAGGSVAFHPKAMIGAGYDSNVFNTDRRDDAKTDTFYRVVAGGLLRWQATPAVKASVDGEFEYKDYAKQDKATISGGRGKAVLDYKGESVGAGLDANYERFNDPLVQTGEQILRQTYGGGAYLSYEGKGSRGRLSGDIKRTEYLENVGAYAKDERSYNAYRATGRYARIAGADTEVYLKVTGGGDTYDKDRVLNDNTLVGGQIGIQSAIGGRSKILAEAGAQHRMYSNEFRRDRRYDDKEVTLPVASLILIMPYEEGSEFRAQAFADGANSLSSNAMNLAGTVLSWRVRVAKNATALAKADWVRTHDTACVDNAPRQVRDTGSVTGGLEYAMMDGIAVRGLGKWTSSYSRVSTDYNRGELFLDLAAVF